MSDNTQFSIRQMERQAANRKRNLREQRRARRARAFAAAWAGGNVMEALAIYEWFMGDGRASA